MTIKPQQRNLLIFLRDLSQPEESAIVIPDTVEQARALKLPYGEVINVGPDCEFTRIGDKVLFMPGNLIGFEQEGEPVYIIPEVAVMATYVDASQEPL